MKKITELIEKKDVTRYDENSIGERTRETEEYIIKRKVKISPDIVKKVGAVIPLKYCHKLKAKFV